MSLYCHPDGPDPNCPLCRRAERDQKFAAAMGAVPPPGRKAEPQSIMRQMPAVKVIRQIAAKYRKCIHLGKKIPGQPCGSSLHACNLLGGKTTRFKSCEKADRTCVGCEHEVKEGTTPAQLPSRT